MKMMLGTVLSAVALQGCLSLSAGLSGLPQRDPAYEVEAMRMPATMASTWAYVSFEGRAYLEEKERKKAAAELREPDFSRLPETGILLIQLNAHSIGAAEGKYSTYILQDATGKELVRRTGTTGVPDYDVSEYGTRWYAYDSEWIDQPVTFPLTIRVVNALAPADYYEYRITRQ